MEKISKKFIRNWVYFGILFIAILAFWAADWWSWKLVITLPMGVVAYFSIAIPIGGGTYLWLNQKNN